MGQQRKVNYFHMKKFIQQPKTLLISRNTHIQTDRLTGRQTGRQVSRHADRKTDRQKERQTERQNDRQTDRKIYLLTD